MKILLTCKPICVVFGLVFAGVLAISVGLGVNMAAKCCRRSLPCKIYSITAVLTVVTGVLSASRVLTELQSETVTLCAGICLWVLIRAVDTSLGATCVLLAADSVAAANQPAQIQLTTITVLTTHIIATCLAATLTLNGLDAVIATVLVFYAVLVGFARTIPIVFPRLSEPVQLP